MSNELMTTLVQMADNNNLEAIYDVISEWRATAEAVTNPRFMDVINTKPADRNYTEIN